MREVFPVKQKGREFKICTRKGNLVREKLGNGIRKYFLHGRYKNISFCAYFFDNLTPRKNVSVISE